MEIFSQVEKYGLGIVLAILLFFLFKTLLKRVLDSHLIERNNYKELLERQSTTLDNHIDHLTDKIGQINTNLSEQKECLTQGFQRVVDAIKDNK